MVLQTGPTKRKPITIERARRLRREQTVTEMLLWRELRAHRFHGIKFRRQVAIGPFIVDFYCAQAKLIIEVDGNVHTLVTIKAYDRKREQYLREGGYRVLRFTNDDVNEDMLGVLRKILESIS